MTTSESSLLYVFLFLFYLFIFRGKKMTTSESSLLCLLHALNTTIAHLNILHAPEPLTCPSPPVLHSVILLTIENFIFL
ncbi:hypothetical protein ACN38_g13167 [Penicillium nordicum]|uniref:Uncharacterized protein n=1 Tax=Penicillium nordicum TaxID=229535 RepID=A0A0M8NPJ3_9EURO|nr:hypothetical protein ACN38_g13167 [Penicillium nordicum]